MKLFQPSMSFMRLALLLGGGALSVGSSGIFASKKNRPQAVTVMGPQCAADIPATLEQRAAKLMQRCRAAGGDPTYRYLVSADSSCPAGTQRHGVAVTCDGAALDDAESGAEPKRPTSPRASSRRPAQPPRLRSGPPSSRMARELLAAHNKYRHALNIKPLVWSDTLAAHAAKWAGHLAELGGTKLIHAQNIPEGENIWVGTAGQYSFVRMVNAWGSEKKDFVYGTFPDVSRTGRWQDVGHYTQMIWRSTTHVGCAMARAGGNDILVCRYSPPGNYRTRKPY